MRKGSPVKLVRREITWALVVVLSCAFTLSAQPLTSQRAAAEQKTATYFDSIRKSPPHQLAFLLKMPKGGDLHNHLSGAIYAESYISRATAAGHSGNNRTMSLPAPAAPSTCDANVATANTGLTIALLYWRRVDPWSMRS